MTQLLGTTGHLPPEQLNVFVDRECSPDEALTIEQHLTNCHECTLRVLAAIQLKTVTSNVAHSFVAPSDAIARLRAQVRPEPTKNPVRIYSFGTLRWAAVAACVVVAFSIWGWRQARHTSALSGELLDEHLAVLSSTASPQVVSTDRHTVKPWFQGKLPFSFNLPEVLPADTTLKGGDLAYVAGQPAALLLFTIHKHEVSVFLTQRKDSFGVAPLAGRKSGFVIHYATTPELSIAAVSDVNSAELDLLIKSLVEAQ